MNTIAQQPTERRLATQDLVEKLLAERRQMLVLFCRVAGLEPYTAERPTIELLQEFCQVLVDYSAFGHFEIYERIANGQERRRQVIEVAEEVYGQIADASETAVEFNDKYDAGDHAVVLSDLPHDLSVLGEELALRVESEDRLVSALLAR
ncbi:MAG: Rsd/AlgQ family anti-sigma factor [Gammaproteobacteria bacterium]|jgi:regulator of sigma D